MLSIRECKDIIKYFNIPTPSNLRKVKEKAFELYQSKICMNLKMNMNGLPLPFFLFRRQSKNFRMTRKQRLSFYLV